jgi:hypothetical protein
MVQRYTALHLAHALPARKLDLSNLARVPAGSVHTSTGQPPTASACPFCAADNIGSQWASFDQAFGGGDKRSSDGEARRLGGF